MRDVLLLQQIGYYAAVVPLALCFALLGLHLVSGYLELPWFRSEPVPDAWLISAAFALSFLADTVMKHLSIPGGNNWWVGYIAYPLQFGLLVCIVAQHKVVRWVALTALAMMALASGAMAVALRPVLPPETSVRLLGGIMVGLLALGVPHLSRFKGPLILYGVGCIPGILAMVILPRTDPNWLIAWGGYQIVRLVAVGWLAVAVVRPHLAEVSDGPRTAQGEPHSGHGADRTGIRPVGGGRRHIVAQTKR